MQILFIMSTFKNTVGVAAAIFFSSCSGNESKTTTATENKMGAHIKAETISYQQDSLSLQGFAAWDTAAKGKRPVVMVVHEWWGLTNYTRSRVKQLAALGYFAFAVDMYGNGATADNPTLAGEMSAPFYKDAVMARNRFDAGLAKALSFAVADSSKVAAIGYCFGGTQVLNFALLGDKLNAVVSFHGGLKTTPPFEKNVLKSAVLVCHGEADPFVPEAEAAAFKKGMDSIGAPYTFKGYANASHAFTNPDATELGKKFNLPIAYNAAADSASWQDMKQFLEKAFQ